MEFPWDGVPLQRRSKSRFKRLKLSFFVEKDMLRSLSSAGCQSSWPTTSNLPQISLRTLQTLHKRRRMPFKLIALASCGFTRRQAVASQSCVTPKSLPLDVPVDEETIPGYDPKNFYHPNPGAILDHRYKLKAKIGWGTSSTVWLAQDIRR